MATYWENSCSFGLRYVSWYKYLIVSLFFSHLGFWSGNLFLIAPFPDLCLLVPFNFYNHILCDCAKASGGSCILVKSSLPQREIKLKANLQAKAVSVSDLVRNPEDWFFLTSRLNYS